MTKQDRNQLCQIRLAILQRKNPLIPLSPTSRIDIKHIYSIDLIYQLRRIAIQYRYVTNV